MLVHTQGPEDTSRSPDHNIEVEVHDAVGHEWVTPDFTEQATCAEICAYVFVA